MKFSASEDPTGDKNIGSGCLQVFPRDYQALKRFGLERSEIYLIDGVYKFGGGERTHTTKYASQVTCHVMLPPNYAHNYIPTNGLLTV